MIKTLLLLEAYSHTDLPYIYGANHPIKDGGFDCSGYVNWCLMKIGYLSKKDRSAQMLFDELSRHDGSSEIKTDSILFFGDNIHRISHTSIAVNDEIMLEAGGGDNTTTNIYKAAERNDARVRVSRIDSRKRSCGIIIIELIQGVKYEFKRNLKS